MYIKLAGNIFIKNILISIITILYLTLLFYIAISLFTHYKLIYSQSQITSNIDNSLLYISCYEENTIEQLNNIEDLDVYTISYINGTYKNNSYTMITMDNSLYSSLDNYILEGSIIEEIDYEYQPIIISNELNAGIGEILEYHTMDNEPIDCIVVGKLEKSFPYMSLTTASSSVNLGDIFQWHNIGDNEYQSIIFTIPNNLSQYQQTYDTNCFVNCKENEQLIEQIRNNYVVASVAEMRTRSTQELYATIYNYLPQVIVLTIMTIISFFMINIFLFDNSMGILSICMLNGAKIKDCIKITIIYRLFITILTLVLYSIIRLTINNPYNNIMYLKITNFEFLYISSILILFNLIPIINMYNKTRTNNIDLLKEYKSD